LGRALSPTHPPTPYYYSRQILLLAYLLSSYLKLPKNKRAICFAKIAFKKYATAHMDFLMQSNKKKSCWACLQNKKSDSDLFLKYDKLCQKIRETCFSYEVEVQSYFKTFIWRKV
jgi:hypothetical protein